jgi:hypothetical protein
MSVDDRPTNGYCFTALKHFRSMTCSESQEASSKQRINQCTDEFKSNFRLLRLNSYLMSGVRNVTLLPTIVYNKPNLHNFLHK